MDRELREQIIKLVEEEIRTPSFGVVEQALQVHKPIWNGEQLQIVHIDDAVEANEYHVYIPLHDEVYFLVVIISRSNPGELRVQWAHFESNVYVYLSINSDTLRADEITQQLSLIPTRAYNKDDTVPPIRRPRKHTGWIFEPLKGVPGSIERKVEHLLKVLEPHQEKIRRLQETYPDTVTVVLQIAYYGYKSQMWGWHIEPTVLQQIARFGIAVDLDLYASGPDLPP